MFFYEYFFYTFESKTSKKILTRIIFDRKKFLDAQVEVNYFKVGNKILNI